MTTLTIENYLKTIYQLTARMDDGLASTGAIAAALDVSPGTVTSMLKTLSDANFAEYLPYEGVRLRPAGKELALRILRRHRLIELFLVNTLELSWDQVHEEAENMEHAMSDLLIDRIATFLGDPQYDPHGDPIPAADGSMPPASQAPLDEAEDGQQFRIARVLDQSPQFLRYLSDAGIHPGVEGAVASNCGETGVVCITIADETTSLPKETAAKLLIATPAPATRKH